MYNIEIGQLARQLEQMANTNAEQTEQWKNSAETQYESFLNFPPLFHLF